VASQVVLVFDWVIGSGDMDGFAFVRMEFHTPLILPQSQVCEVILEDFPIIVRCNFPVQDQIIGKEFGAGLDIIREAIDEYE